MRFCMLTTFYPPWSFGGDAIQVRRLAHALADAGHEVTVVHSPEAYRALGGGQAPAPEGHPGVEVVPIDAHIGPLSPFATYMTGRPALTRGRLERVLGRGFDVLHFHNPSLLGGPALLGMGEGIKLYTLHEQWLVCPTHVLFKYRSRVCEKPDCWRCTISYRRPPQPWRSTRLVERSLDHVDALLAPSRTTASLHDRFRDRVRIERLPHFIADPGAGPAVPPGGDRPYFLYVGRLERIKGVGTLLGAFRRRRSEDLVIAGDGPLLDELRREAADLPHVRFVGWRDGEELDALYRGALATVVPTLGHESFPLVLLESFARGRPAVVRRFGALAELADESGAALAYSSEDELDEALARLAGDPELGAELGARGREAYLERWTPDAHLGRYLALIDELSSMSVLVLTYHGIDGGPPPLFIGKRLFAEHLDRVVAAEVPALTVTELAEAVRAGALSERAVAITFDDGFATVVRDAVPLLRERGLRATVFCVAAHLGGLNDFPADPPEIPKRTLADEGELREAVAEGVLEVGSHGMRHLPLAGLDGERLRDELAASRRLLEERVGAPVRSFAYPYAVVPGEAALAVVRETYDAAVASGLARVEAGADPHLLPRVDAHYLRRPRLMERALAGRLGGYMALRRAGARARRLAHSDYRLS